MTIPKEIREKIEQKLRLDEEIKDWMNENLDIEYCVYNTMKIQDNPSGKEQLDGEWCDQTTGYLGYDFCGHYYWPMDNGKYLCMYFEC